MTRRRGARALLAAAVLGSSGLGGALAGQATPRERQEASPGPIWLEIQATPEEMERVMAIARRLNARLRDDRFLADLARASAERRYDDLADMVAEAAGVSPGWVKAGAGATGERVGRSGRGGSPAVLLVATPGRAARRGSPDDLSRMSARDPRVIPREPGAGDGAPRESWYLRYQSRSWAWCIAAGTCPP